MSIAAAITDRLTTAGLDRQGDSAIYTVLFDDHSVHCVDESMLDVWWLNLAPETKAEIFDAMHEGDGEALRNLSLRCGLAAFLDRLNRLPQMSLEIDRRTQTRTPPRQLVDTPAVRASSPTVYVADLRGMDELGAKRAFVAEDFERDAVTPASRHPASLNRSPVDAVETRR